MRFLSENYKQIVDWLTDAACGCCRLSCRGLMRNTPHPATSTFLRNSFSLGSFEKCTTDQMKIVEVSQTNIWCDSESTSCKTRLQTITSSQFARDKILTSQEAFIFCLKADIWYFSSERVGLNWCWSLFPDGRKMFPFILVTFVCKHWLGTSPVSWVWLSWEKQLPNSWV